MRLRSLGLLLLALGVSMAAFAAEERDDLDTRVTRLAVTYTVNPDATYVEQREYQTKILTERAVSWSKQDSVTFSTSIQTADVVYAYTLKADGRRIDVPSGNFQLEINKGKDKDSPVYSDRTTLSVVFPDVSVGDSVVFAYKLTAKEPLFPGHFSEIELFSRKVAYDDVRITFDTPLSMWTQYKAHDFQEVSRVEKEGRRVLTWAWQNKEPEKRKPDDYGIRDPEKEPGIFFSTFRSYADIAEAYGNRARLIAAVTPRVQALADEITKGVEGQRNIARALYEWVAKNISYAGNCIGLGAVVPRDIEFVLNNRMGDCKDHATVYQALLTAKGIKSIQALVNAGGTYTLPEVPVVAMVNHVINYLPDLNLYADSTSDDTPFGMLPFSDADKPVLWVDGYRAGTKTPAQAVGSNRQVMKTEIWIAADGSAKVNVNVDLKGHYAVSARSRLRNVPKSRDTEAVKQMLKGMNLEGDGTFFRGESEKLIDTMSYGAKYQARGMYMTGSAGAFPIYPMMYSEAPVHSFVASAYREPSKRPVSCASGASAEEYTIHLPKTMKVLALSDNIKLKDEFSTYSASYARKGNVLYVKREIEDRTPGHVCSPESVAAFRKLAQKIVQNMKAQVVYQ